MKYCYIHDTKQISDIIIIWLLIISHGNTDDNDDNYDFWGTIVTLKCKVLGMWHFIYTNYNQ